MKKHCLVLIRSLFVFLLMAHWAMGQDGPGSNTTEEASFRRAQMVETQLKARGIKDSRVLKAMGQVQRHRFVPPPLQNQAYGDHPLPIGEDQTISQPYIVALMTELLALKGPEKVLEIGTGSGYQAAVLAELTQEVYTIEIIPSLALRAKDLLPRLGYTNVTVKSGDGYLGWPEKAPFDAIIVTAAPDHIPQPLIDQLKEGGRLVLPIGTYPYQVLKKGLKKSGRLLLTDNIPVLFVPMTGEGVRQRR